MHPTLSTSSSSSALAIKNDEDAVVVGDLHASGLKLIYFLLAENRIELSEVNYKRLVELHQKARTTNEDALSKFYSGITQAEASSSALTIIELVEFCEILEKIKPIQNQSRIIEIGDDFFDRAGDDALNLMILQKLHTLFDQPPEACSSSSSTEHITPEAKADQTAPQPILEILLSNHGFAFIKFVEILLANDKSPEQCLADLDTELRKNPPFLVQHKQFSSFFGLRNALINGTMSLKQVQLLCKEIYFKKLKLLSYSLSENGDAIAVYSHAIIDHFVIYEIAQTLKVNFNADSPKALAATIERINQAFQQVLEAGTLSSMMQFGSPLYTLIWNRSPEALPSHKKVYKDQLDQPYSGNLSFPIFYVHGHCGPSQPARRTDVRTHNEKADGPNSVYYNLDNPFGLQDADYIRAISRGRLLTPEERCEPALLQEGQKKYICTAPAAPLDSDSAIPVLSLDETHVTIGSPDDEPPPLPISQSKKQKRRDEAEEEDGPGKKPKISTQFDLPDYELPSSPDLTTITQSRIKLHTISIRLASVPDVFTPDEKRKRKEHDREKKDEGRRFKQAKVEFIVLPTVGASDVSVSSGTSSGLLANTSRLFPQPSSSQHTASTQNPASTLSDLPEMDGPPQ